MKKLIFLALMAALVANCKPSASSGGPEVWKCEFKGSYKGAEGMVPFTWAVTWTNTAGENWSITGESTEANAKSTTTGTCDSKTCKIDETYTAGEDKGKSYYWLGTYTDAETKSENVLITSFTGTYGASDADRTSMGTWSAKADCKR